MALVTCPGCRAVLPATDGPTHPYIESSPACWARYGEVLAREFQDPAYFGIHQLTVDTYAVQHPGGSERRAIQSVAVHLMTLALMVERGLEPRHGPALHRKMVNPTFHWLEPPPMKGRMTVLDVAAAETPHEHEALVRQWATDVWAAWQPHHATVYEWIAHSLTDA